MTGSANSQELILPVAIMAGVVVGGIGGLLTSFWIVSPLENAGQTLEHRQRVSEQRERRACLVVALLCYYVPALIVVEIHTGMAALIPYMRAHLLDGFGCAALFAVALGPLRWPLAEASMPYKPGFGVVGRAARAGLLLTCGSVAIAVSAAWIAGGGWAAVLLTFVCTYVPTQLFWGFVAHIISSAAIET
jgi:hypothetical protein